MECFKLKQTFALVIAVLIITPCSLCLFQSVGGIKDQTPVQLRNLVLLDYLDQVVFDIETTPGSCFNTEVEINDSCRI